MQRPSVVLPEPLSPTMPRVSPRLQAEADIVQRLHGSSCELAAEQAAGGFEAHAEIRHVEDGVRRSARLGLARRDANGVPAPGPSRAASGIGMLRRRRRCR